MNADHDSAWKNIIEYFFQKLLEFLFPQIHAEIDWSKPFEFLDKELLAITKKSKVGKRISDKLVKVYTLMGDEAWVNIHIEIQEGHEKDFATRMFEYYYKIYDRYKKPLMCAAILTDYSKKWRPDICSKELWGCHLTLKYPIIKLIDFEDKLDLLDKSDNPIAKIIQVHLIALKTRDNPTLRQNEKIWTVKKLAPLRYEAEAIRIIYEYIDMKLQLPDDLELEYMNNIKHFEEEIQMRYITSVERLSRKAASLEILQLQLETKFGKLDQAVKDKLEKVQEDRIKQIFQNILTAENLEELIS